MGKKQRRQRLMDALKPAPFATPRWQAMDPVSLACLAAAWQSGLVGAKVQKLQQHGHHEWVLQFWKPPAPEESPLPPAQQWTRLLISVNRQTPTVALLRPMDLAPSDREGTALLEPAFQQGTPLCLALRKFLQGARLASVSVEAGDNVLYLTFDHASELGFRKTVTLALELMGKYSNLILFEAESRQILALSTVITSSMSGERSLSVGGLYQPPPRPAHKPLLSSSTANDWQTLLEGVPAKRWVSSLQQRYWGCPKALIAPLVTDACTLEGFIAATTFFRSAEAGEVLPALSLTATGWAWQQGESDALPLSLMQGWQGYLCGYLRYERFAATLQRWLLATLRQESLQEEALAAALDAKVSATDIASQQAMADALMTLYSMRSLPQQAQQVGPTEAWITLPNPLTEADEAFGPFQLGDTWLQATQRAYKQVHRLKGRLAYQQGQLQLAEERLMTLRQLRVALETAASSDDLACLEGELVASGCIKAVHRQRAATAGKSKGKAAKEASKPALHTFTTPSGLAVWVGKNNLANAQLVGKLCKEGDWWFHVGEGITGAHVLLKSHGSSEAVRPQNESIALAGGLAAWFSSARQSGKVPVLMAPCKYLQAIPKSWPGHVRYQQEELFMLAPQSPF